MRVCVCVEVCVCARARASVCARACGGGGGGGGGGGVEGLGSLIEVYGYVPLAYSVSLRSSRS